MRDLTIEVTGREVIGEPESVDGGIQFKMVTTVLVSAEDGVPIDPNDITASIAGQDVCEETDDIRTRDIGGHLKIALKGDEEEASGGGEQAAADPNAGQVESTGGQQEDADKPKDPEGGES